MKNDSWLSGWIQKLAEAIESKVELEGYKLSAKPGKGPVLYVTVKGGSEDSTTAHKAREALVKLLKQEIHEELHKLDGVRPKVSSYNKDGDLVLECEILFP
jgi:hypothetical protein